MKKIFVVQVYHIGSDTYRIGASSREEAVEKAYARSVNKGREVTGSVRVQEEEQSNEHL